MTVTSTRKMTSQQTTTPEEGTSENVEDDDVPDKERQLFGKSDRRLDMHRRCCQWLSDPDLYQHAVFESRDYNPVHVIYHYDSRDFVHNELAVELKSRSGPQLVPPLDLRAMSATAYKISIVIVDRYFLRAAGRGRLKKLFHIAFESMKHPDCQTVFLQKTEDCPEWVYWDIPHSTLMLYPDSQKAKQTQFWDALSLVIGHPDIYLRYCELLNDFCLVQRAVFESQDHNPVHVIYSYGSKDFVHNELAVELKSRSGLQLVPPLDLTDTSATACKISIVIVDRNLISTRPALQDKANKLLHPDCQTVFLQKTENCPEWVYRQIPHNTVMLYPESQKAEQTEFWDALSLVIGRPDIYLRYCELLNDFCLVQRAVFESRDHNPVHVIYSYFSRDFVHKELAVELKSRSGLQQVPHKELAVELETHSGLQVVPPFDLTDTSATACKISIVIVDRHLISTRPALQDKANKLLHPDCQAVLLQKTEDCPEWVYQQIPHNTVMLYPNSQVTMQTQFWDTLSSFTGLPDIYLRYCELLNEFCPFQHAVFESQDHNPVHVIYSYGSRDFVHKELAVELKSRSGHQLIPHKELAVELETRSGLQQVPHKELAVELKSRSGHQLIPHKELAVQLETRSGLQLVPSRDLTDTSATVCKISIVIVDRHFIRTCDSFSYKQNKLLHHVLESTKDPDCQTMILQKMENDYYPEWVYQQIPHSTVMLYPDWQKAKQTQFWDTLSSIIEERSKKCDPSREKMAETPLELYQEAASASENNMSDLTENMTTFGRYTRQINPKATKPGGIYSDPDTEMYKTDPQTASDTDTLSAYSGQVGEHQTDSQETSDADTLSPCPGQVGDHQTHDNLSDNSSADENSESSRNCCLCSSSGSTSSFSDSEESDDSNENEDNKAGHTATNRTSGNSHFPSPIFFQEWQVSHIFDKKGGVLCQDNSDVTLCVSADSVQDNPVEVYAAVCADVDHILKLLNLPDDAEIASPLAEYWAGTGFRFKRPVSISLPHCLPSDYDPQHVRVYHISRNQQGNAVVSKLSHEREDVHDDFKLLTCERNQLDAGPIQRKPHHSEEDTASNVASEVDSDTEQPTQPDIKTEDLGRFTISSQGTVIISTCTFCGYVCVYCGGKPEKAKTKLLVTGYGTVCENFRPLRIKVVAYIWDARLTIKDFRKKCDVQLPDKDLNNRENLVLLESTVNSKLHFRLRLPEESWFTHCLDEDGNPMLPISKGYYFPLCCKKCRRRGKMEPISHKWRLRRRNGVRPSSYTDVVVDISHVAPNVTPSWHDEDQKEQITSVAVTVDVPEGSYGNWTPHGDNPDNPDQQQHMSSRDVTRQVQCTEHPRASGISHSLQQTNNCAEIHNTTLDSPNRMETPPGVPNSVQEQQLSNSDTNRGLRSAELSDASDINCTLQERRNSDTHLKVIAETQDTFLDRRHSVKGSFDGVHQPLDSISHRNDRFMDEVDSIRLNTPLTHDAEQAFLRNRDLTDVRARHTNGHRAAFTTTQQNVKTSDQQRLSDKRKPHQYDTKRPQRSDISSTLRERTESDTQLKSRTESHDTTFNRSHQVNSSFSYDYQQNHSLPYGSDSFSHRVPPRHTHTPETQNIKPALFTKWNLADIEMRHTVGDGGVFFTQSCPSDSPEGVTTQQICQEPHGAWRYPTPSEYWTESEPGPKHLERTMRHEQPLQVNTAHPFTVGVPSSGLSDLPDPAEGASRTSVCSIQATANVSPVTSDVSSDGIALPVADAYEMTSVANTLPVANASNMSSNSNMLSVANPSNMSSDSNMLSVANPSNISSNSNMLSVANPSNMSSDSSMLSVANPSNMPANSNMFSVANASEMSSDSMDLVPPSQLDPMNPSLPPDTSVPEHCCIENLK